MADELALDGRASIRALLGSPQTTGPAILTLALAIGANTAVFSVVNTLLVRQLPVHEPERLVSVSSDFAVSHGYRAGAGWSYAMWTALQQRSRLFGGALAWSNHTFSAGPSGERERMPGAFVSGEFFQTLGVRAAHGRALTAADDRPGAPPVAMISHAYWLRRFAGAATAVGSALMVDNSSVTIVGIMPPSFQGLEVGQPFHIALPINAEPAIRGNRAALLKARTLLLLVMLRLRDRQTIEEATTALRAVQTEIVPAAAPPFVREPFTLVPASGGATGPTSAQQMYRRPLLLIQAWVALVLVIACVNVTNLFAARAAERDRELAIRASLGASGWRLARPLLLEMLFVAAAAGVVGIVIAPWAARAVVALSPFALTPVLDLVVAVFTAAVTLTAAILCAVAPAVRSAVLIPGDPLKAGATSPRLRRLPATLVVLQVALAVVLTLAAGLLVRSFLALRHVPLGFDADGVLIARISAARPADADDWMELSQRLLHHIRSLPGVTGAAASSWTPLSGEGAIIGTGAPDLPPDVEITVLANFLSPGWLDVYGMPLLAGRDFSGADAATSQPVVIVNETLARHFGGIDRAVGNLTPDGRMIVGVARDAVYRTTQRIPGMTSFALREPIAPTMYAPLAQLPLWPQSAPDTIRISVRGGTRQVEALAASLRMAIASVDPSLAYELRPAIDDVRSSLARERFSAIISATLGGLSLALCATGIYGVTSSIVSRRRLEVAVRMALGATTARILRDVVGGAARMVVVGIVLGLLTGFIGARFLSSMLFGIDPLDPLTAAVTALVLTATGLFASFIPALRAARTAPAPVLRGE